jgi:hypothetical protein
MPPRRAHTDRLQIITEEGDPDRDSIPLEGPYVLLVPTSSPWNTLGTDMIGVCKTNGAVTSPTLISPRRYAWLHAAHYRLNQCTDFLYDLKSLMLRYHLRSEIINPRGRKYKPSHQWATLPKIQWAIELTFQTRSELFASSLSCSMEPSISYCTACPKDSAFGALHDAFSYRLIGSCTANPEYYPGDMRKAIIHALASSTDTTTPIFVVIILPVWKDTPWNSTAIRSYHNLNTLIQIPTEHMRFVPAHKHTDGDTASLPPVKWPDELVLISNEKDRNRFVNLDRINPILTPALRSFCQMTTEQIKLFPNTPTPRGEPTTPPL